MADVPTRITILDDHPQTLDLMREVLEADGYAVSVTSRIGPELHQIRDTRPDLVIIDLRLATDQRVLSGWDVVRLARSHADLHRVPILVISADHATLRSVAKEAEQMRDVRLLAKPFGVDQLGAAVREALVGRTLLPAEQAVASASEEDVAQAY